MNNLTDINSTKLIDGFTVLMAVYKNDDSSLLARAVNSVYENTLVPTAFILVVDGPVPQILLNTINFLQARYDIDVLYLQVNVGLARALNQGLRRVCTKWVFRADSDDYNLPDRFALQVAVLNQVSESFDIVGGAIQEFDSDGVNLRVRRTVEQHQDIKRYAAYRNPFNHMTVAYRTSLALRCGGYPEIYLKEDYALWALMIAAGANTYNLPDILVHASAGREMYKRRGGLKYAIAEISLQHHLVTTGLKSPLAALIQGSVRAAVFMLPANIRGWIYENVLRVPALHYEQSKEKAGK